MIDSTVDFYFHFLHLINNILNSILIQKFDHVRIGTGQATGTLLSRLIQTGENIAVMEGGKVGGSCINYGCTPTKTLVASARAIHMAKRGKEFGFNAGPVE